MAEIRKSERFNFTGSGTKTVTVASNEFINVLQVDISTATDTTFELKIGSEVIFTGPIIANAVPVQLFLYDFGKGRGTGVKGDDLTITLGAAGDVFVAHIKFTG